MKIECEVLTADNHGDKLSLTLQGKPPNAADWRDVAKQTMLLPWSLSAAKAFHVGRIVYLTIKPK